MSAEQRQPGGPRRSFLGPRLVGALLLALGLLMFYESFQISEGGGYSIVGPRFFPLLVSIGVIGLSALFLLRTTVMPDTDLAEQAAAEEASTHWPTVGLTALALALYPFALDQLGYIVGTTLFVPLGARILGSRSPLRDLAVGIVLSVVVYVGFTRFLGVRLPDGLLGSLF